MMQLLLRGFVSLISAVLLLAVLGIVVLAIAPVALPIIFVVMLLL